MTEAEHAARSLQQSYFGMVDAGLYLDTHAKDDAALRYFRMMNESYRKAKSVYEKNFGAVHFCDDGQPNWNWVKGPWPWEGAK